LLVVSNTARRGKSFKKKPGAGPGSKLKERLKNVRLE
jgi:hypothetical protein